MSSDFMDKKRCYFLLVQKGEVQCLNFSSNMDLRSLTLRAKRPWQWLQQLLEGKVLLGSNSFWAEAIRSSKMTIYHIFVTLGSMYVIAMSIWRLYSTFYWVMVWTLTPQAAMDEHVSGKWLITWKYICWLYFWREVQIPYIGTEMVKLR